MRSRIERLSVMNSVRRAVSEAFGGASEHLLLAVSGGRDSMVLLDAAAKVCPNRIAGVATFDHATGPAATEAADLVERRTEELGLRLFRGRAGSSLRREAEWREARWRFLRGAACSAGASVITAHTRDDQVETVLMRVLRGSGARGLAALYASSGIVRPLLSVPRSEVTRYAEDERLSWVDDPSNLSLAHLRNRIRLDILPALERAQPGFSEGLLHVARRASELRAEVDAWVTAHIHLERVDGELRVAREELLYYDAEGLALLWPAIAAHAGASLDRRGTKRVALFTIEGKDGTRVQVSGGHEIVLHRGMFHLRRETRFVSGEDRWEAVPLADGVAVGRWRFRERGRLAFSAEGLWSASLPAAEKLQVRFWRPGDRMRPLGSDEPRRIKGLFRDAGVDPVSRASWPVVVAGDEIVWVPGVRRGFAAADRPGRPAVHYICERIDR